MLSKGYFNLVYIAKSIGLDAAANWDQVIIFNNHQRKRFAKNILIIYTIQLQEKITLLGWAFKKDTNDTRESASIYVADLLMDEMAKISVFDPKVSAKQIFFDLNYLNSRTDKENRNLLTVYECPYEASKNSHAIAILTEWDQFKEYDWKRIYNNMSKPAFIFDGRNILDKKNLKKIGFIYRGIGKS